MLPPDFPDLPLETLLKDILEDHLAAAEIPVREIRTDEGVSVELLGYAPGSLLTRYFFRIRGPNGTLGVPLELELAEDGGERLPVFRAEAPFWHAEQGVATLLAPTPIRNRKLWLRVRQVRLFDVGPGSRPMKVRVLAPRPVQPPPVPLPPVIEERYRASLRVAAPVEPHHDVFGFWDFDLKPAAPPPGELTAIRADVPLLDHRLKLVARSSRALYATHDLDFTPSFSAPPAWEGLSAIVLSGGSAGVGTFRTDGTVSWLFAEDIPPQFNVTSVRLYRLPARPPLSQDNSTLTAPPVVEATTCEVKLHHYHKRTVYLGPPGLISELPEATREQLRQDFIEAFYSVDPRWIRPYLRFVGPDQIFDRDTPWDTPLGESYTPLPPRVPHEITRWDVPFVNLLLDCYVPVETLRDEAAPVLPPPLIPPRWFATGPFRAMS